MLRRNNYSILATNVNQVTVLVPLQIHHIRTYNTLDRGHALKTKKYESMACDLQPEVTPQLFLLRR